MISRRRILGAGFAAAAFAAMPRQAWAQDRITPAFKLFDCHGHFYTFERGKYPFHFGWGRTNTAEIIKKAEDHPMRPRDVFAVWDEAGIAKGLGVQYNTTYSTDNRYLLDIAERYPDRILPIVILNATDKATPLALEMMAKYNDIVGVRFTGQIDEETGRFPFLSDEAAASWEAANELGLNITLMPIRTSPTAMEQIAEYAAKYPNVAIVIDHIGWPVPEASANFGFSPQHLALADHANVHFKYTTLLIEQLQHANVPLADFLEFAAGTFGANKMVWGTDIGNTPGDMVAWTQTALRSAQGLSADQQKAIFWDNANRIFVPGGRGCSG